MKKRILISVASLFVALMFIISCQKETRKINPETDLNASSVSNAASESNNKCRLVFKNNIDWFFTDRYTYNSEGLLETFKGDYFGNVYVYAKMEYDKKGRVLTGGISYDGVTYDKVVFEYDK